jgi:hypothetical protein
MHKNFWSKPCHLVHIKNFENKIEKFPDFIFAVQEYGKERR